MIGFDKVRRFLSSHVLKKWRWVTAALVILCTCVGLIWFVVPRDPELTFDVALSSLNKGDLPAFDRAIRSLEKNPELEPYADFLLGVRLLRFGRTDSALQRFSRISPTGRLREPLLFYNALALETASRKPEAVALLSILVRENPDNAEAHRWLGIIYYDLGAYDLAILHLREVTRLVPDDFRPYRLMGIMYRDFAQDKEAIESYRAALDRNPPEQIKSEMALELAASLIAQKNYDEAMEVLLKLHSSAIAETLKARCFLNSGNNAEAMASLEAAKRLSPDERAVFLLEAEILSSEGKRMEAVEILRKATAVFPYDAECRYQLGLALRDAGQVEEAQVELAEWNRLKALATQLTEKNFRALSNPRDSGIREELAQLCEQLGKHELAVMWRQAAAALRTAESPGDHGSERFEPIKK